MWSSACAVSLEDVCSAPPVAASAAGPGQHLPAAVPAATPLTVLSCSKHFHWQSTPLPQQQLEKAALSQGAWGGVTRACLQGRETVKLVEVSKHDDVGGGVGAEHVLYKLVDGSGLQDAAFLATILDGLQRAKQLFGAPLG